ncbi:MAG: prepilin-type N-terminal cleavage/methylation domain-containing protein [Planctomycetes bacterium]|nr:prepilin-type N-terminal cleavage/methylation domain-containing protein [Planctomycetota bacterium]
MSHRSRHRSTGGFTIVEVLVVVAIIALLAVILLPSLVKARQMSQISVCLTNFHHIGVGMVAYAQAYRGWMPAGPADQLYWSRIYQINVPVYSEELQEGGDWRPILGYPWQYGGRRALWQYLEDEDRNPLPEKLVRPLTGFVHRGAGLDTPTPEFACPADKGLDYWDRAEARLFPDGTRTGAWDKAGLGRRPVHVLTGNSYYLHLGRNSGRSDYPEWEVRRFRKRPGEVFFAYEAVLEYDRLFYRPTISPVFPSPPIRRSGWHGQAQSYTILYLDTHAEYKFFKNMFGGNLAGPGYYLLNYRYVIDYYR